MALLHGRELFKGEGINLAENIEFAFSRLKTLFLFEAHIRVRLRVWGIGGYFITGHRRTRWYQLQWAVLGNQYIALNAKILECLLFKLLNSKALLGASYFIAMHAVL